MNYFGHAAIASWSTSTPAAILGAMLPDFASMCGGRLDAQQHAAIADGIALHHRTDGVFHDLPVVHALMRELDQRLERLGCARGPKLAVAHVGVELLLDGVLVDDAAYRAAYLAGIACDTPVAWLTPEDTARFATLLSRLRTYGVPDDLRSADAIVHRLQRVLAPRPRLAPSTADVSAIRIAITEHQARVVVAAETVLRGLRASPL